MPGEFYSKMETLLTPNPICPLAFEREMSQELEIADQPQGKKQSQDMKIAMMTRWNVPSGQSVHAEPIAQTWQRMGHQLKVFSPQGIDLLILQKNDEPFVHRCYMLDIWGQRQRSDYFFDPRPFLEEDYQIFVVELAELMPMPELLSIFPQIKKKAKTVLVVHEVGLPKNPNWYKFDWDAIVCFDARYREFMAKAFPREKIAIIPYPCHPPRQGDKTQARIQLGLPLDKRIVFAYGFNAARYYTDILPALEELSRDYPLLFLLLTHHGGEWSPGPDFLLIREEMPSEERLYTYLHASDAYVYYVRPTDLKTVGVGVSSSVATCLGAGCPTLVPACCNFFDLSGKEVIKFGDLPDLRQRLQIVFENTDSVKESLAAAQEYVIRNSSHRIAAQFLRLFEELLDNPAKIESTSSHTP